MVFIHPMYGCNDIRLNDYDIIKAVGQGLTIQRPGKHVLCWSFIRYPSMSVVPPQNAVACLGWLDGYTTNISSIWINTPIR